MTTHRPFRLIASALVCLTLVTGCGGGGGRPSVSELSESLQGGESVLGLELDETQADCIAEAFHDSDISDETLQAIVDNDEDYQGNADDQDAITSISTDSMVECMAG